MTESETESLKITQMRSIVSQLLTLLMLDL